MIKIAYLGTHGVQTADVEIKNMRRTSPAERIILCDDEGYTGIHINGHIIEELKVLCIAAKSVGFDETNSRFLFGKVLSEKMGNAAQAEIQEHNLDIIMPSEEASQIYKLDLDPATMPLDTP